MSFMPPEQIDNVWALLKIINDPEKAKNAVADMRSYSQTALEAFQKARDAQQGMEKERAALAKLRLSLDEQAARLEAKQAALDKDIDDKKKHFDTLLEQTAARQAELDLKEQQLKEWDGAHQRDAKENAAQAAAVASRALALASREKKVQSILDDLGPLAAKLKL